MKKRLKEYAAFIAVCSPFIIVAALLPAPAPQRHGVSIENKRKALECIQTARHVLNVYESVVTNSPSITE